jgi:hypothetical protein
MECVKGLAHALGLMGHLMKETGRKTKGMATEYSKRQMDTSLRASGSTTANMVKAFLPIRMGSQLKAPGRMTEQMDLQKLPRME